MNSEVNKKEPMFYVAIRANKGNKNNEVTRTDWIFDVQIYSEENSDESEAMESQIINIKRLYGKKTLHELREEASAKHLDSDQHHLQISEIDLAFERFMVSDEGNKNIYRHIFMMFDCCWYLLQKRKTYNWSWARAFRFVVRNREHTK